MRRKKIYIANTSGLGNRLETLVLAGMIEDAHGHAIYLDWPEADCLTIAGTQVGSIPWWDRIGSLKLRDFDQRILRELGGVRVINLRGTYGPRELQKNYLQATAARLQPHSRIGEAIRETLAPYAHRPAVAVHIRRGDFAVAGDTYDANASRHPAPALWWYEHVMSAYVRQFPDVYFVLGYSGDSATLTQLKNRFEIVTLPRVFDYQSLLPGHLAEGHPVVDMFGLACCSSIVVTPTSSFSHWAANLLGVRAVSILPPVRMERSHPRFGVASLWGSVLLDWRDAAERGIGVRLIGENEPLPLAEPATTDWL